MTERTPDPAGRNRIADLESRLVRIGALHPEHRPGYTCQRCMEPTPCTERRILSEPPA